MDKSGPISSSRASAHAARLEHGRCGPRHRDEISPLAVGQHLHELLQRSDLAVYPSSSHWFVHDFATDVADRISSLLADG